MARLGQLHDDMRAKGDDRLDVLGADEGAVVHDDALVHGRVVPGRYHGGGRCQVTGGIHRLGVDLVLEGHLGIRVAVVVVPDCGLLVAMEVPPARRAPRRQGGLLLGETPHLV